MSEVKQTDELTKSIDSLIEELFAEPVEKSIDIAGDAKKTADAALASVPSSENDENRGAGRPKQISDVPETDEDGSRDGEYDGSIASSQSEDEPEETEQSPSIDQTSGKGRMSQSPKAPESAPFKKSLTEEEYTEYLTLKKAKEATDAQAAKIEELKKAETAKKDQEVLVKSAVEQATSALRKENEELRKSVTETNELVKAMASQPRASKSITGIEALEKSSRPEEKEGKDTFTKSEILDAAFDLAKSGKLAPEIVSEIEMTGSCSNPEARRAIEKKLAG